MKLLITGGSSYLGRHIMPLAADAHDVAYTYYTSANPRQYPNAYQNDIRDETAFLDLAKTVEPAAIIHLAGSNRNDDMENVIVAGATTVMRAAKQVGAKLIFISSDVIFDGNGAPYAETAAPAPLHAYAAAKVEAESIVATCTNHAIIRTSLIYSTRIIDRGTEWMKDAIERGQPFTLFTNQLRQPVHADELARACLALAGDPFTGILNVAGRDVVTRAAFGQAILDYWGVSIPDTVSFAPDESGRWPIDTRLDLSLARHVLPFSLTGVHDHLPHATRRL